MITKFKLLVLMAMSLLILYTGCTFDEPGSDFTIEERLLSISFDRDTYDFSKMLVTNNLDTIAIGDSIRIESIIDSSTIDFDDLRIQSISESQQIPYAGTPIPAGIDIPRLEVNETYSNFGGNDPDFAWARVDTGRFTVSVYNGYKQLEFDSIVIQLVNNLSEVVSESVIEDLEIGLTGTSMELLDSTLITRNMNLLATIINSPVQASLNTQGVDNDDYLNFTLAMGDCSVDSAFAKFHNQAVIDDSLYAVDVEDIKAREIITKDTEIRISVRNTSPFYLDMRVHIDSLTEINNNNTPFAENDLVNPNSTYDMTPRDLDYWSLKLSETVDNEMAIFISDTTYARSGGSGTNMVVFHKNDEAKFFVTLTNVNSGVNDLNDFQAYSITGELIDKEFNIDSSNTDLGDDIDWDEFSGLQLDSIGVWLKIDINNDDLEIQELAFDSLFMQGHKNDGTFSELVEIEIDPIQNLNDTIIRLYGLEDIINFHPDEISYEVKALINDDDITILDSDIIKMDLQLGVPLQATVTDTVIIEGDVEAMEAVVDTSSLVIEALYFNINSYINNPFLDMETKLFVNLSESVAPTYDGENDSLVGTIYTLLETNLRQNDNPGTDVGYMLYDENGEPLDNDAVNKLLSTDTYIQQKIVIYPDTLNPIIMLPQDYIQIQLKMDGKVKISIIEED